MIKELDADCAEAIRWIEEDLDKNRYADDSSKNGFSLTTQHLLYRFKQMHEFH
ncbi:hypothetical protein ACFLSX_01285 [Calditrichota bacterium]